MVTRAGWTVAGTAIVCVAVAATTLLAQRPAGRTGPPEAAAPSGVLTRLPVPVHVTAPAVPPDEVVATYCVRCHNDSLLRGGLSLETFDLSAATERADVSEKMIRKLQAGMMPPPGSRRPDAASLDGLTRALEATLDAAAAARPTPGTRPFPRLNRAEYARAIKDLLDLDVDAATWLPLDQMSANFDNIADEQTLSATLLEAYLNAAADVSRLALGDVNAVTLARTFTNTSYISQHPWDHIEGAPFGTRGGMVVNHIFPADAEYVFELTFTSGDNSRFEDVDISIDGHRVALVKYETGQPGGADGRGAVPMRTDPIVVRAGQHRVAAAFVRLAEGPYEDIIRPHDWSFAGGGSGGAGITTLPHLRDLIIHGPYRATGLSPTSSRNRVFRCRPTAAVEERPCARAILTDLARQAWRRPVSDREIDSLSQFYDLGAAAGGFEVGVRTALEAVLASPHFIFRLERQPVDVAPGTRFPLADVDLASRLSFFLWGTPPDARLRDLAARGALAEPATLEAEARRLLADARADALGWRFAAQWLRLQDVDKVHPDPNFYPDFDDNLAGDMKRETVMFFNDLVRRDRSVLDLYRADYTFLNERLARHYGLSGVSGRQFRRVPYPDATRRGLLGQGSILVQTSMANRTSPVLRGKWVMEVLLGTPPPPPPPLTPTLEEQGDVKDGRTLTTREKLEVHREDPTCNACHRFMDPIGLALDNFDVTGRWRERERGMPLDTRGDFYDGTPVSTPGDLATALLKRPVPLVRTFTENLMSYALGRRVEPADQPAIRAIAGAAEANQYRMSSFILGVVTADAFRHKQADPDPTGDGRR
ncbi:MAG TPA: DUF1592 domain-containing protein [Vicinamibacterales bacterium]|nr:DUF1592 domain-containing protein [Vicinamibacterales bacterium]